VKINIFVDIFLEWSIFSSRSSYQVHIKLSRFTDVAKKTGLSLSVINNCCNFALALDVNTPQPVL